jgi:hypothetical protein
VQVSSRISSRSRRLVLRRFREQNYPGTFRCPPVDFYGSTSYGALRLSLGNRLESYAVRLEGKEQVRIICMDLAIAYRSIVKKQFPPATMGRSPPRDPARQPPLPGPLARERPGRLQEPRLGLIDTRHRHSLKLEQRLRLLKCLVRRPALDLEEIGRMWRITSSKCINLARKRPWRLRRSSRAVARRSGLLVRLRYGGDQVPVKSHGLAGLFVGQRRVPPEQPQIEPKCLRLRKLDSQKVRVRGIQNVVPLATGVPHAGI